MIGEVVISSAENTWVKQAFVSKEKKTLLFSTNLKAKEKGLIH